MVSPAMTQRTPMPEALAAHRKALALRRELVAEAGAGVQTRLDVDPKTTLHTFNRGWSHALRGWALVRAGQPAAAADLRRAVELWARLPGLDVETRFKRSRVLALLAGLGGDAQSGVTAAEAQTFADQALTSLRDAFSRRAVHLGQAGTRRPGHPPDARNGRRAVCRDWDRSVNWAGRRSRRPARPGHRRSTCQPLPGRVTAGTGRTAPWRRSLEC